MIGQTISHKLFIVETRSANETADIRHASPRQEKL